ncbi:MAG TPA: DUF6458 family protein [Actinomycetota bacterium]|jgi:hypothetical protein|nr:DUF6458 family protein [Actinomycetota bacterium]
MGIGASVFLMAIGAILTFAVEVPASGIDLDVVGVILMFVGFVGFFYTTLWWSDASPWRRNRTVIRERYIEPTTYAAPQLRDVTSARPVSHKHREVIEYEERAS